MTTKIMLAFLKFPPGGGANGALAPGGVNFDAKVRRESFEPVDLFHAHIGGMDTFAKGLKIAAEIRAKGELAGMVADRYASWDSGVGAEIEGGKHDFKSLEKYMLEKGDITPNTSGRQELYENVVNRYVL
jgi:xylose isomerase